MARTTLAVLSGFMFLLNLSPLAAEESAEVDLENFPVVEGKVVQVLGHLSSFLPPEVGDRLTLDLSQLDKLQQLEFEPGTPEPGIDNHYIPLPVINNAATPLQVESIKRYGNGAFQSMRLIAPAKYESAHTVKVHVSHSGTRVWIMVERDVLTGVVLVEGTVKGTFPDAAE